MIFVSILPIYQIQFSISIITIDNALNIPLQIPDYIIGQN